MRHRKNVSRRDLLGTTMGSIALAALGATRPNAAGAQPSGAASSKPNILFILADDLGYADVSCYGWPDLSTPNIDRIAADGTRFMQAYANSAVCTASRVALISRGSVTGQQLECDLFDECAGHNRTSLRYEPQFQRLSFKIVLSARRASARNVIKRGWPADSRWPQALELAGRAGP